MGLGLVLSGTEDNVLLFGFGAAGRMALSRRKRWPIFVHAPALKSLNFST